MLPHGKAADRNCLLVSLVPYTIFPIFKIIHGCTVLLWKGSHCRGSFWTVSELELSARKGTGVSTKGEYRCNGPLIFIIDCALSCVIISWGVGAPQVSLHSGRCHCLWLLRWADATTKFLQPSARGCSICLQTIPAASFCFSALLSSSVRTVGSAKQLLCFALIPMNLILVAVHPDCVGVVGWVAVFRSSNKLIADDCPQKPKRSRFIERYICILQMHVDQIGFSMANGRERVILVALKRLRTYLYL